MPDFRAYVRENLTRMGLSGADEGLIVEELALEFQENYERALRNGRSAEEAWDEIRSQAIPWEELCEELRAELEGRTRGEPETTKSSGFFRAVDGIRHDFRYAVRQLLQRPAFTIIAMLTLALGIGANTAIFGLMNAVLLRSLPIHEPQRLVFFGNTFSEGQTGFLANARLFSYPFYREFSQGNEAFADVAAVNSILFGTHGRVEAEEPEPVRIELVSGSYFDTLGVHPILGRLLENRDDQVPDAHPLAVASYSWWQRRFEQDPKIVGKTVHVSDTAYEIVGVAPPGFFGVTVGQSPDLWIPLTMEKEISPGWNGLLNNRFQTLHLIARIKSGLTLQQADAATNVFAKQILLRDAAVNGDKQELDAIQRMHILLTPATAGRSTLRLQYSAPLEVLMMVVALVLVIACANVANLLLTRAAARRREIAIRMSVGAMRLRLVRQLFLESGLLAFSGALIGGAFAWIASRVLLMMVSTGSEILPIEVTPDGTVLAFTLVVTVITVLLFGTVPAFYATRVDPAASLSSARGAASTPSRNRLSRALIVVQVALSFVLLVGAGLFLRSFSNLIGVDIGFDKQNVLVTSIEPGAAGYRVDARLESMMDRVEERVRSIPGVEGATFVDHVFNDGSFKTEITVPGRPESREDPHVVHKLAGPDYIRIMKMPLVMGRDLELRDTAASRKVAVINQTMARVYFPTGSPLGRTFSLDEPGWQDIEVVGVVKDAKYLNLEERSTPAAFYPRSQYQKNFLYTFIVRYTGDASSVSTAVKNAVKEVDPNLPLGSFTTLSQLVDDAAQNRRVVAQLSSFFGMLAAFLASIGIYGVISYGVTRRTGEFGIRMALGASRPQVLWVVLREALWLAVIGVGLGLILARASTSFVRALLFGIESADPAILGAAVLAMTLVALIAGYLPARRATRTDPMVALRHE